MMIARPFTQRELIRLALTAPRLVIRYDEPTTAEHRTESTVRYYPIARTETAEDTTVRNIPRRPHSFEAVR